MYHAHEITISPFYGGERPVTGQGRGTTYMVTDSWKHRYILCFRAAARWQAENQEGMAEVARFIEMNGSFADENRDW